MDFRIIQHLTIPYLNIKDVIRGNVVNILRIYNATLIRYKFTYTCIRMLIGGYNRTVCDRRRAE